MLVNNWKRLMRAAATFLVSGCPGGIYAINSYNLAYKENPVLNYDGTIHSFNTGSVGAFYLPDKYNVNNVGNSTMGWIGDAARTIKFGRNNDPTIASQIDLNQRITSGLNCTVSTNRTQTALGYIYHFLIGVTNTSSSPITIGEIGYYFNQGGSSGDGEYYKSVLIDRTPLETPLTLQSQESASIDYTVTFEVPYVD